MCQAFILYPLFKSINRTRVRKPLWLTRPGYTFILLYDNMEWYIGLAVLSDYCGIYSGGGEILQRRGGRGKNTGESNVHDVPHTVY